VESTRVGFSLMVDGLLGKKLGMTQVLNEDGLAIPVTIVQAGPCVVVQRKTVDTDGYDAVQLGLVEFVKGKRVGKPMAGHFKKADVPPVRFLREIRLSGDDDVKAGDRVQADIFKAADRISVTGTSKGRGFAGVIKRHGFHGGGATHGSMFHRAPGSIGQSAYPSRVFKGTRMPGHMGVDRVTVQGVRILEVDAEKNLLYLRGAVPGPNGGYVVLRRVR
jgi:large subunit ribosomal protein L3